MKKIFNQDNFILGIAMGTIIPWVSFGIIYLINLFIRDVILNMPILITTSTLYLIAIVANVFVMRHYLVKLKYDKTGRGLLIMTFIYIIAYFAKEFVF